MIFLSLKDRSSQMLLNDIDFNVSLSILIYDDGGDNRLISTQCTVLKGVCTQKSFEKSLIKIV